MHHLQWPVTLQFASGGPWQIRLASLVRSGCEQNRYLSRDVSKDRQHPTWQGEPSNLHRPICTAPASSQW
jgi:hypothetical protein